MVLRLVSNINTVQYSLFDMVGAPVIRVYLYDLGFVSLDSAPALETIDEIIFGCFLFIEFSLGEKDCTAAIERHILHDCG